MISKHFLTPIDAIAGGGGGRVGPVSIPIEKCQFAFVPVLCDVCLSPLREIGVAPYAAGQIASARCEAHGENGDAQLNFGPRAGVIAPLTRCETKG